MSVSDWATRYVRWYGLALVDIPLGRKAPMNKGWNKPGGWMDSSKAARSHWDQYPNHGIGAVLAPSGLCSVDVDNPDLAAMVLGEAGIDLERLCKSTPTIQGNPARYRLMFKAHEGLSRHALAWDGKTIFELRAGAVQDVLPPTVHPGTGRPYRWLRQPNGGFPDVPEALLALWRDWGTRHQELDAVCPLRGKARPTLSNGRLPGIIAAFNDAHTSEAILHAHGYKLRGNRWLSPTSDSKLAGVVILDGGRVYSHHASDPLNDGHSHDAFDVYRILDHEGDFRSAVRTAAALLAHV